SLLAGERSASRRVLMAKLARLNPFLLLAWALILAAGAAMAYGHTVWGSVALLFSAGFVRRARTNAVAGLATQDDQLPRPSPAVDRCRCVGPDGRPVVLLPVRGRAPRLPTGVARASFRGDRARECG